MRLEICCEICEMLAIEIPKEVTSGTLLQELATLVIAADQPQDADEESCSIGNDASESGAP